MQGGTLWQDHRLRDRPPPSPSALPHTFATAVREAMGVEAVSAALGHSKIDTSLIYAPKNLKLQLNVAKQVG